MGRIVKATTCAFLVSVLVSFCGCGETEDGSLAPIGPCESRGEVDGIRGQVAVPACNTLVPGATVTLWDELRLNNLGTAETDVEGEFFLSADDGRYLLTAKKGPYQGPQTPAVFEVSGGRSDYQVIVFAP